MTLLTNSDKAIQTRVKEVDKGLKIPAKTKDKDMIVDIHQNLPLVVLGIQGWIVSITENLATELVTARTLKLQQK